MPRRPSPKRKKLLKAAAACFAEYGVHATTIAMIAERAEVPIGNVYYYYKTKDAFAGAVVAERLSNQRNRYEDWAVLSPLEALLAYVDHALSSPKKLAAYGCPQHALVMDLRRLASSVEAGARTLLLEEEAFVTHQVAACTEETTDVAQWLLAAVRGAKTLAHEKADPAVIERALIRLRGQLRARLRS